MNKEYKPPVMMVNGHIQTIYPSLFRKIDAGFYVREKLDTPDGDFLEIDWSKVGSDKVAIITHGLEGSSRRAYVAGMARHFNSCGWDSVSVNLRSCSGKPNLKPYSYHCGSWQDLALVTDHALKSGSYRKAGLVGFSMGGGITLNYLGRMGKKVDSRIKGAVAFSVPCDLKGSSEVLDSPSNILYMKRFLRMLRGKIKEKMVSMPGEIDDAGFESIRNFKQFDDKYTAPLNGFRDAEDYWEKCSAKRFIGDIGVPALICNAANDPFLSPSCTPVKEARSNPNVTLEIPASGGHVGFVQFGRPGGAYWSEERAAAFLENEC